MATIITTTTMKLPSQLEPGSVFAVVANSGTVLPPHGRPYCFVNDLDEREEGLCDLPKDVEVASGETITVKRAPQGSCFKDFKCRYLHHGSPTDEDLSPTEVAQPRLSTQKIVGKLEIDMRGHAELEQAVRSHFPHGSRGEALAEHLVPTLSSMMRLLGYEV